MITPFPSAMLAVGEVVSSSNITPLKVLPPPVKAVPQLLVSILPLPEFHIPSPVPFVQAPMTGVIAQAPELPSSIAANIPTPVVVRRIDEALLSSLPDRCAISVSHTALPEFFFPRATAVSATATNVPTFSFQILRYDLFINRIDPLKTSVFYKTKGNTFDYGRGYADDRRT
jgi:hypothetical protein